MAYLDRCIFVPNAGGTADFVVSTAVQGYQTPASASAKDQAPYYYAAQSADLTQWEVGTGAYTVSSTTLARTTVFFNSLGTTAKINFTNPPNVGIVALAEGFRELLTADRTYYVRTDGSDSNSGFVNSAGGAWLTRQHAFDVIAQTLDVGGHNITVQLAAGTYSSGGQGCDVSASWVGAGTITFQGDTTTPANVILSDTLNCFLNNGILQGILAVQGFRMTSSSRSLIYNGGGGLIQYASNEFNTASQAHLRVGGPGALMYPNSNETIIGGAASHYRAEYGGVLIPAGFNTTLTGTPNFSTGYAHCLFSGTIDASAIVFTGSATGPRYALVTGGNIYTGGGGATYFPGNSAGTGTAVTGDGFYA